MSDTLKHSIHVHYNRDRDRYYVSIWGTLKNHEQVTLGAWLTRENAEVLQAALTEVLQHGDGLDDA